MTLLALVAAGVGQQFLRQVLVLLQHVQSQELLLGMVDLVQSLKLAMPLALVGVALAEAAQDLVHKLELGP